MDYVSWIYVVVLCWIGFVTAQHDEQYRCPNTDRRRTQSVVPFRGKCYQFVHEERYWSHARDYCREYGGRLVTVNDAATNSFLIRTLNSLPWSNSGVWIGLHDRDQELRWQWSTESDYVDEPVRFQNWGRGHPKAFLHSLRDCVRMRRKGGWKWHETPCSALKWKYRFICQYGMRPASTTTPLPTYPPGFHQPLQNFDWGNGWARGGDSPESDDARITADDVMSDVTTASPRNQHNAKTTTKAEFYEEDSINVIVPMQLTQNRGKDDGRGNMIFGIVGCVVALLCIMAFIFVIFVKRRKRKEAPEEVQENPMYGATEKDKGHPNTGRVMNIYTNPSEQLQHPVGPESEAVEHNLHLVVGPDKQGLLLESPSEDSGNHYSDLDSDLDTEETDLDLDNVKNEQLEDASQYLEPQVCMANRPLPEVTPEVKQGQLKVNLDPEVKVKRKPQRFVRPKSPHGLRPFEPTTTKGKDSTTNHLATTSPTLATTQPEVAMHVYEDAEDVQEENEYAEIPGENFYETLDDMKKSLATMSETHA